MKMKLILSITLVITLILSACKDGDTNNDSYGIFTNQDDTTVTINGVIGSNTPNNWDSYIATYPDTKNVVMMNCPGSDDDEANLQAARKMRQANLSIHLPATAEIASGAVDLYLCGATRTRESGSRIGVHSWSDGTNDATSFPVGHENHVPYIEYYKEMGFSQADAEAFYYFTINAAEASSIHWMTDEEISQYKLVTQ